MDDYTTCPECADTMRCVSCGYSNPPLAAPAVTETAHSAHGIDFVTEGCAECEDEAGYPDVPDVFAAPALAGSTDTEEANDA